MRITEHVIAYSEHEPSPVRHLLNRNAEPVALCGTKLMPLSLYRRYEPGDGEPDATCLGCVLRLSARIAAVAHGGHIDLDGRPHIDHVRRVAEAVADDRDMAAAVVAFLHDVIEDTSMTYERLVEEGVPAWAASAVAVLSRARLSPAEYMEQITGTAGRAGSLVRKVKLADARDNFMRSVQAGDESRTAKYRRIVEELERVMGERGELPESEMSDTITVN